MRPLYLTKEEFEQDLARADDGKYLAWIARQQSGLTAAARQRAVQERPDEVVTSLLDDLQFVADVAPKDSYTRHWADHLVSLWSGLYTPDLSRREEWDQRSEEQQAEIEALREKRLRVRARLDMVRTALDLLMIGWLSYACMLWSGQP